MGRAKPCSICSSPVAAEINEALQRREKLRDIEARTAFSRSALSRHANKCITHAVLREHKETKKLDGYNSRLWVKMPDEVDSRLVQDVLPSPWWRKKPEQIVNVRLVCVFEPLSSRALKNSKTARSDGSTEENPESPAE